MGNLVILENTPQMLNNSNKCLAVRSAKVYQATYVQHIGIDEVRLIGEYLKERDRILLFFIFDGCFRVSEALSIRPCDIKQVDSGWSVNVLGKGRKRREVAISASIAAQVQSYAYRRGIGQTDLLFPIKRSWVWQLFQGAMCKAGIVKPDGVGYVHLMRHSGALVRLSKTGNPQALQDQLGHSSVGMTMRYLRTQGQQQSLKIQCGVDHKW